ncbi:MAG: hypothetical protein ACYTFW_23895, partial [Planctomycetota bacterium]
LEPDNKPSCTGPELFSHESARTTIFKRRLGRIYFQTSNRHIALIDGRLFCSRDPQALNRIVDLVNKYPRASGKIRNVMQVPLDDSILWAGKTRDVCGLAVGDDGLVVLHHDSAEGVSIDGRSLWNPGTVGRRAYRERVRGDTFGRICGVLGQGFREKIAGG